VEALNGLYQLNRVTLARKLEVSEMSKFKCYYRTSDGTADYCFSFEEQLNRTWRAYIEEQPSYQSRETDSSSTHRLTDGRRKYICWTKPLNSLEEAKQVAALWADKTQNYIRTGSRF
jgi:hypothetical protein